MIPLVCDFETFYDREYSLSKITTEAYVRDPRFEVIGVAIKIGDGETKWYPKPVVLAALAGIDWSDKMVVCQNTAFDGAILKWHYGISPMAWADTLGMSRALFPHEKSHSLSAQAERLGVGVKGTEVLNALGKRYADFSPDELASYAAYCVNDVELTHKLFMHYLGLGFPRQELRLIDATLRMFIEPRLVLDRELLTTHLASVKDHKQKLLEEVRDALIGDYSDPEAAQAVLADGMDGVKKLLMSNDKFAKLLERFGVEPPMKVSPTTGKLAYAFAKTDEAFKELAEHPDVRVQALVAARLGNKTTLEETRTERFIEMADRGRFPVPLRYYGAHTGRFSGCLVADTQVLVYDSQQGVVTKRIVDVLLDDLVWDGEAFVAHEGVKFSGFQEVIEWDGVTGTPEHVVFTDAGEISLRDAMQGGHRLTVARSPIEDDVDAARRSAHFD